jgi:glucosamine kinase
MNAHAEEARDASRRVETVSSLFVGVDGGGTKTEVVILDAAGSVRARQRGGAASPVRLGFRRAAQEVTATIRAALRSITSQGAAVGAICAGLAGAGAPARARRLQKLLESHWPGVRVSVCSDLDLALDCFVSQLPLVVLVAGTGSVAACRMPDGSIARAGGWGPWFDDEGGATDLGRRALAAAARAVDGHGPATALVDAILAHFHLRDWSRIPDRLLRRPFDRMAELAPLVESVAAGGDTVARQILEAAAGELLALVGALVTRCGLAEEPFAVGLLGGLLRAGGELARCLERKLRARWPRVQLVAPERSPGEVAAQRARSLGLVCPAAPLAGD